MSPSTGRLLILTASILWSTSGAFVKYLALPAANMAMYRTLVAATFLGLFFALQRRRPTFHPVMILMVLCFATMNYTFVASLTLTSAANSIFLQYTAPLWMTLASYLLLGEGVDRRTVVAITGCLAGVAIIVVGNREASSHEQWGLLLGLAAGFFYAGVAVSLRYLREHDPRWLAFLNHFVAGTSLLLVNGIGYGMGTISGEVFALPNEPIKMAALLLFGILQMGLPYVLFARGLASITAQEAGILTLIEPVLTPIWAFLMAGDLPTGPTLLGGIVLLAALAVRYIPIGGRTISKSNGKEHADVPPQDP